MKQFEYLEPASIEEACNLVNQYPEGSKIISGGTALLILMKQRLFHPQYLISIKQIPGYDYITFDNKEGLKIGGLSTHSAVEKSPIVREKFPIIAEMETKVANVRIRNMGTVGGNLSHAEPQADPPAVLLALDANVKTKSPRGERNIPLDGFFINYYETVLEKDEILTEIRVPITFIKTGCVYKKFTYGSVHDKPCVGIAVSLIVNGRTGKCRDIRIAMGSVGSTPLRAKKAEEIVKGEKITDAIAGKAANTAAQEAQPVSDVRGSEWFKKKIVNILVRDGILEAHAKTKGGGC